MERAPTHPLLRALTCLYVLMLLFAVTSNPVHGRQRVSQPANLFLLLSGDHVAVKPGLRCTDPQGMLCSLRQVAAQVPSVYVPQMGDDVVYLRVGHARFLESRNDKRQPPWESPSLAVRPAPAPADAVVLLLQDIDGARPRLMLRLCQSPVECNTLREAALRSAVLASSR